MHCIEQLLTTKYIILIIICVLSFGDFVHKGDVWSEVGRRGCMGMKIFIQLKIMFITF